MVKQAPSLAELRREIRRSKVQDRPPRSDDPTLQWIRRHHDRICDYLVQHLEGYPELIAWRVAYTALHELLGAVWFQPRPASATSSEERIWATFDPLYFTEVHYPTLQPFSLLPDDFSPRGFQHHYEGFFRFLAARGLMTPAHAEHLVITLHRGLWGDAVGVA